MIRFAFLATALLAPVFVFAHSGHSDDPIKARRAYFTLIGTNMGTLGDMAKGKRDYDSVMAEVHAANLSALAAYDANVHFPASTSKDDHKGKTRALPSIWTSPGALADGYLGKWDEFSRAIAVLSEKAGQGKAELGGALGNLGATCKACHDDYRAKDF